MNPRFPTDVEAEPGIVAKYAAMIQPRIYMRPEDRFGKAHIYCRTDVTGLMANAAKHAQFAERADHDWLGTRSLAEALTLAQNGWREPVADIVEQCHLLTARKTRSLIPNLVFIDEPGVPDIATYLSGESDCFVTTSEGRRDTPAVGRAVRIILEPCVSAGISTTALVQRGAVVATVAHTLEQSGVRVAIEYRSLISADGSTIEGVRSPDAQIEVTLKEFGAPVDLRGLAFWLTHPSASRRFVFSVVYAMSGITGNIGWAQRHPDVDANTAEISRLTTFEHGGNIDRWTTATLALAGIEVK